MKLQYSFLAACCCLLFSCSKSYAPLETVADVDIERYMGKWYEISSIPQSFQRGCFCTTAVYELKDGYVSVLNSCRKDARDGKLNTAEGKAFVANEGDNSKLKVQFFWPFRGDYWIVELGENYEYAAVGAPGRNYLWILSRTPQMEAALYDDIVSRLKAKQFPVEELVITDQGC